MKQAFLLGALALVLLVQSPFIFALDCSLVSPSSYQTCIAISNLSLNQSDKDILISNLDYSSKFFPDHNYIYQRNTNLLISNSPDRVKTYSGQFVNNAWMSIFAVMPSVIYNNSLLVPNKSKILIGSNSTPQIPQAYSSSGYPSTNQGDCKRIYTLTKNTYTNDIYINNNYAGSGKLVDLTITKDSEIKSIFNINIAYRVNHYGWTRYCCRRSNGYCVKYCYSCDSKSQETKEDKITIQDSINVMYYNNTLIGDLQKVYSNYDSTRLRPNYSNSIEINLQDSSYKFNQFVYSINYSKPPYYISTLKADNYNQETTSNILKNGNDLIVKNTNNCSLRAFDFFNAIQNNCSFNQENINFYITTDRLKYYYGENVLVSIYPINVSANITYGNESRLVQGSTNFIVKPYQNKIAADYKDYHSEKIIFIFDKSKLTLLYELCVIFIISILLYKLLNKCFGDKR